MLPTIDVQAEIDKIVRFISQTYKEQKAAKLLVACSGGIDSSVTFALTVKAIGVENVHALLLPYKTLYPQGVIFAKQLLTFLKVPESQIEVINMAQIVDVMAATLAVQPENRIRFGNLMARARMIAIYDKAKKYNALVVGTENRSEYHLGYFTRFGDEASDLEPVRHLYKTHIYQLAESLQIPEQIRSQQPTAGLWESQSDESEFGFAYKDADPVLYLYFDKKMSVEDIEKNGLSNVKLIIERALGNHFKHLVPYTLDRT